MTKVVEYQNCKSLVMAEITQDDASAFVTGAVEEIAPVAEISKTTAVNSAPKYYDGQAMLIVSSEGNDEIALTLPILALDKLAKAAGKYRDPTSGILMDDGKPGKKYFAIGYKLEFTDGTFRYIWRLKGSFKMGDESAKQIGDGTETTNQKITYVGIITTHEFTYPNGEVKGAKAMIADEADGLFDVSDWFSTVKTPDNISTGKVATPVIALASGVYDEGATETAISCATTDAVIRYTTDGTEPTSADTLYSEPVDLPLGTTVLKAKAFKSGRADSNTATAWYVVSE